MANQGFSPKLYKFVLPREFSDSALIWNLKNYKVKVPSYSVLLSHTFAVIWHVFNKDGAELICFDRADIAWALAFLEAFDTTSLADVSILDLLIKYLRKILVSRYALEDEKIFSEVNQTVIDTMPEMPSSAAYEDFHNSAVVQADKKKATLVVENIPCTDDDIMNRLKQMNPNIQSLQDVLQIGNL